MKSTYKSTPTDYSIVRDVCTFGSIFLGGKFSNGSLPNQKAELATHVHPSHSRNKTYVLTSHTSSLLAIPGASYLAASLPR